MQMPAQMQQMHAAQAYARVARVMGQLQAMTGSGQDEEEAVSRSLRLQRCSSSSTSSSTTSTTPTTTPSTTPSTTAATAPHVPVHLRPRQRAVIISGARTPFVKSFTTLMHMDSIALGVHAVGGLIRQTGIEPRHIDQVIMGNVVVSSAAPNIAREIVLDLHLPTKIPGTTVSVACLSGLEAVALAVQQIETHAASVVVAGGSDSLSNAEMPLPKHLTQALAVYSMAGGNKKGWRGVADLLQAAGSPLSWLPKTPAVAERSTGKTMGFHADLMAEIHGVTRAAQDAFAVASHQRAAAATARGDFRQEIVPVPIDSSKLKSKGGESKGKSDASSSMISVDGLVRGSIDAKKVAELKPAFRPAPAGTVTAASSSALTDGASAVLVMSESRARELGYPVDISVRSYAKCAFDPFPQLLMAPAVAIPQALERAGLTLDQIDLFELHEAFAAQVLATLKALQDAEFCAKYLNRSTPVGTIDPVKINLNGGSLAIGHPFAATGGRLVAQACHQLRVRRKRFALISICAAGGIGGVMILERSE